MIISIIKTFLEKNNPISYKYMNHGTCVPTSLRYTAKRYYSTDSKDSSENDYKDSSKDNNNEFNYAKEYDNALSMKKHILKDNTKKKIWYI